MSLLTVRHTTVYGYSTQVELGEHRVMFRPRESHDLNLLESSLRITPHPAGVRWVHDPFDNSVAVVTFEGSTSELRFDTVVTLEHLESELLEYPLEEYAKTYPFTYSDEELPNLALARVNRYPSESVKEWANQFSVSIRTNRNRLPASRHDARNQAGSYLCAAQ